MLAADAMKLAFLEHAQELRLGGLMQVAGLVKEERAAVGQFELPAARAARSGERALLMAEHLAFEQLGRNGGAVHLDERTGGERALAVNVRGQQFLAGAGFPD